MLTKKSYAQMFAGIRDSGGLTEDMRKDVDKLEAELDERDGLLRKYGETYDGEAEGEWDFKEREVEDYKSQYEDVLAKYNGLSARYADMMENSHSAHETDEALDESEGAKVDTDYDNITISDIITEKEG